MIKKLFAIIAVSALASYSGQSQLIKFGPELGLEFTTMKQKVDGDMYNNYLTGGGRIGITFDAPLFQGQTPIFIQPSVLFSFFSGSKSDNVAYYSLGPGYPTSIEDERVYDLYRLRVPVLFTFKTNSTYERNHFTVGVGPYFNWNFGGNYSRTYVTTLNGSPRPVYEDRAIHIGTTKSRHDLRPFDLGVTMAIGYELVSGVQFKAFYEAGLLDLAPGSSSEDAFYNRGAGISIGYLIGSAY